MSVVRRHRLAIVLTIMSALIAGLVFARGRDLAAVAPAIKRTEEVLSALGIRANPRKPEAQRETVVGVIKPERRDLEVTLAFTGDILPARQTPIFAKTSGYIRAIHVEKGDFVQAGQLLAEIEPTEMEAAMEQTRAAMATAVAGLQVARSNLEAARANLLNQQAILARTQAVLANDRRQADRLAELFSKDLVSAQERDNARTAYESSQAAVRAQEAQVQVARVQIETTESQVRLAETQIEQQRAAMRMSQMRLDDTRLAAPFAGYVSHKALEVGAAVSAQAAATSNASIAMLVLQEINPVRVQIEVPERDVGRLRVGHTVRLVTDAYPDRTFGGTVARVVHSLDPRTRTMGVEVDIPNPDHRLKPGMYARVVLVLEVRPAALLIPLEALVGNEARPLALVVREGKVVSVPVELGVADGSRVQVAKGLTAEDQIILQGKDLVRPGQAVRTVPAKVY